MRPSGPTAVAYPGCSLYNARVSAVLRVEKLCKDYSLGDQVVHALVDATLEVKQGEFIAVMGASGSGKSTLLHLVGGLDIPTRGSVVVEGRDLARLTDRARTIFRRQRIGIIFQSFNLLPTLTAAENVALPLLVAGADNRSIADRTKQLLARVDLLHRADHRPGAMSGGEQQRVAIARALINEPALILADEPTGNLDSQHAGDIWRLLRRLADEQQRTILAVTHESAWATFADRVMVLKDGRQIGQIQPSGADDAALVAARYQELAG